MYGKVTDGKLKIMKNNSVSTVIDTEEGIQYVTVFNPSETELKELGYYKLSEEAEKALGTDALFEVSGNEVCVKDEKAQIQ